VVLQGLGRLADEPLMSGAMAASQRHIAVLSASLMFVLFSGAMVPSEQVMCGDIIALGGTCLVTADLRFYNRGLLCCPNQIRFPVSTLACQNTIQGVIGYLKLSFIKLLKIYRGRKL